MLSGLFKRKDKKSKALGEEDDSELLSKENFNQTPQSKVSSDSFSQEGQSTPSSPQQQRPQPQRQSSKLQKTPPGKVGPLSKRPPSREGQSVEKSKAIEPSATVVPQSDQLRSPSVEPNSPNRIGTTNLSNAGKDTPSSLQIVTQDQGRNPNSPPLSPVDPKPKAGMFSPIKGVLRSSPPDTEHKLEKVKKAKERVPMDDFDSSPDVEAVSDPMQRSGEYDTSHNHEQHIKERLSESPVEVSPVETPQPVNASAPVGDSSSQEERSLSPVSRSSSPELIEAPREEVIRDEETPASAIQSSTSLPSWSDASLRTYLEDDTDIRDLLIVVHDKSNIRLAGPDHPIIANLCKEENRRLGEMSTRLDGLLNDWWARKSSGVS